MTRNERIEAVLNSTRCGRRYGPVVRQRNEVMIVGLCSRRRVMMMRER